jgi:hypothetical protein
MLSPRLAQIQGDSSDGQRSASEIGEHKTVHHARQHAAMRRNEPYWLGRRANDLQRDRQISLSIKRLRIEYIGFNPPIAKVSGSVQTRAPETR